MSMIILEQKVKLVYKLFEHKRGENSQIRTESWIKCTICISLRRYNKFKSVNRSQMPSSCHIPFMHAFTTICFHFELITLGLPQFLFNKQSISI